MNKLYFVLSVLFLIGCGPETSSDTDAKATTEENPVIVQDALWRGVISLNDSIDLPFNFWLERADSTMTIMNGEERIYADLETEGDSLVVRMPVFANYLKVKLGEGEMNGYYINPDAENYRLPFHAKMNDSTRFKAEEKNCCDINEKWVAKFNPGTEKERPAIGYFEQKGSKVTGTFMTETGDYRYLEGVLSGNQLHLSAFDGAHLVVFHARIESGQKMKGHYFSGRSYHAPWIAYRDDNFELRDSENLTWLKDGYDRLSFKLPNLKGDTLALSDTSFENRPVIIQILGSWCPNCMDESRHLKEIHQAYADKGLQIVGLTFERAKDQKTAMDRARKMKEDLDLPYPILMAGYTRDDDPQQVLPQLNHIMSFPTTIYLNRNHEVVNIQTGFSGPGTPIYDQYVSENKILLDELVLRDNSNQEKKK